MNTRRTTLFALPVVVLVAVAAWLLWPTGDPPTVLRSTAGNYPVTLTMTNPKTGGNAVELTITDRHGQPATVAGVTVAPAMTTMGHATPPIPATEHGPGRYHVELALPMPGQWELTVYLPGIGQAVFPLLVNG
jgi:hypothetical protein